MSVKIIPIILAGGAGTRLWPLSREQAPKQFLSLAGGQTLLSQTLQRCHGGPFHPRPIIVGADADRGHLLSAIQTSCIEADILLEPVRRNSCAAIAVGALCALERDPDALVLTLAADHHIADREKFQTAVEKATSAAQAGYLVSFGVKPTAPATSYGYILTGEKLDGISVERAQKFVEKPDLKTARCYVDQGYLWNSGNFLFKAKQFLDEVSKFSEPVLFAAKRALQHAKHERDFSCLSEAEYARSPNISVDYAVMEKTHKACVLPVDYAWQDVGTWDTVAQTLTPDANGNAIVGRGLVENSHSVTIYSEDLLTTVIGCNDLIVVATQDAILVLQKGHAESVKALVETLQKNNFEEAVQFVQKNGFKTPD